MNVRFQPMLPRRRMQRQPRTRTTEASRRWYPPSLDCRQRSELSPCRAAILKLRAILAIRVVHRKSSGVCEAGRKSLTFSDEEVSDVLRWLTDDRLSRHRAAAFI